ncbi:MAG TPA: alpha/beta fold hydrolase, partial [Pseudoduganella sp.]
MLARTSAGASAGRQPVLKSVQCISPAGLHRMAYREWGDPANPKVLVCVHGVTRVSDDFDDLARALADTYRVVCPDVVGRGRSGRLRNPDLYRVPQYVSDMVTLLARVLAEGEAQGDRQQVAWFGTSMGGLIGMGLASLPDSPIGRLVLNDIGPVLDPAALRRIGDYIGQDVRFATYDEGARFVREVSASFGPHTDAQWEKLARDVLRQDADGSWVRHYDLALAQ